METSDSRNLVSNEIKQLFKKRNKKVENIPEPIPEQITECSALMDDSPKKKPGRPRGISKYADKSEYYRHINMGTKFKNMTLDKAQKQLKKYAVLIGELNTFIKNHTASTQ